MKTTPASLPRLGLGMAALGRPGYINLNRDAVFGADGRTFEKMQAQADAVLDTLFRIARASGTVPWIDCARSYGLSEKFSGEYLKRQGIRPDEVYVSSKWGYTYVADWNVRLDPGMPHEVKDHSTDVSEVERNNCYHQHKRWTNNCLCGYSFPFSSAELSKTTRRVSSVSWRLHQSLPNSFSNL